MGESPRILIVKLSAIGDCLVASPIARALRQRYPRAHIAWAVQEKALAVVQGNPFVDEIIVQKRGWPGFWATLKRVRSGRFDAVLDLQGALKSAPLAAVSGARWRAVSRRAEPIARRAANLIVPMPAPPPHALEQYFRVASALDVGNKGPLPVRQMALQLSEAETAWAQQFWSENEWSLPVVALNPGSARRIKAWPAAHFAALGDLLEHQGVSTLLVGGPADVEVCAQVEAAMTKKTRNAAGKTNLRQLAALLGRCAVLVSADTGPMHIAAGIGTPVVALFGPTDPRRTGPIGAGHIVLTRDLQCRPCLQQPTCQRFECLTEMPPSDVFKAVLTQLQFLPSQPNLKAKTPE